MRARVLSETLGTLHVDPYTGSLHRLFCHIGGTRNASVAHVFYNLGSSHGIVPSVNCTGSTKVVTRTTLYVACSPVRAISCCISLTGRCVLTNTSRVYLGSVTNVKQPSVLNGVIGNVGTCGQSVVIRCRSRTNPNFSVTSVLRIYGGNYSCVSATVSPLS